MINLKINQLKTQLANNLNEAAEVPISVKVMILQNLLTEAMKIEQDVIKKEQEIIQNEQEIIQNEGETECQIVD